MQDEKRPDSVTPTEEDAHRDATSKETVSDLKKSEEASGTGSSADRSSTPSPDGQFDGPRDGSGIGEETGPM
ncbi:MAG TPA: hypothetical protein VJS44_22805 [Pyrinomonadaceae bacterium]|nr:hypothetical protein [Pyrinomonadaceae bacterium]